MPDKPSASCLGLSLGQCGVELEQWKGASCIHRKRLMVESQQPRVSLSIYRVCLVGVITSLVMS